jgi:hypothetical protein
VSTAVTLNLTAREREALLLARCAEVVTTASAAVNEIEANVFAFASMLLRPRQQNAAARLLDASSLFFDANPGTRISPSQLEAHGWIVSMPRFKNQLERYLVGLQA